MAQAVHARDAGSDPTEMRGFLPHSVAATLAVLAFPSATLFSMLLLTEPNPPVILCSLLSLALSSLASIVGARLWQKHPKSKDVSFGDLMIWSWFSRRRAEARLHRGTAALGLDRRGSPVGVLNLSREEQLRVLHELNEALESKDPYTRGHSKRVERHVFRMGNAMGLSIHEIEDLRLAAVLHDVGKIRIPDHILRKPGKLTAQEYRVMQDHSSVGAWMLSYVGNQDVIEAVRYHHERWDGHGYPDGVYGTDIPLFARMIAVADTFDAITSTRSYRARAARDHGLKELQAVSGSQLDPMCVEIFVSSLPAPVPVAAVLYLLPFGLKKLVREIGVASRRAGLQTIASGVGAASAAVIVTTPVIAPSLGARPAAIERSVGSEASGEQEAIVDQEDPTVVADDKGGDAGKETTGDAAIEEEEDRAPAAGAARVIAALGLDPLGVTAPEIAADTGVDGGTTDDGQFGTADPGSGGGGSGGSGETGDASSDGGDFGDARDDKATDKQNGAGSNAGVGAGQDKEPGSSNPDPGPPDNSNAGGNGNGNGGGNPDPEPPDNSNAGGNGNGNGGGNPDPGPPDNSNAGGNGNGGGNPNPDPGPPDNSNAGGKGDPGGNGGGGNPHPGPPADGNAGGNGGGNNNAGGNGNSGGSSDKAHPANAGGNADDAPPPTSNAGGNGNGGGGGNDAPPTNGNAGGGGKDKD